MCEGSASIAVNCDGVEGVCGGREVLPVGLLTRPRSNHGRSCERVTADIFLMTLRFHKLQSRTDWLFGTLTKR